MTAISSSKAKVADQDAQQRYDQARGRFVPWIIAAFFLSFMIPLIGFTVIAFQNLPSEVTSEAYAKGLAYNAQIEGQVAQDRLAWSLKTRFDNGDIFVCVKSKAGEPVAATQAELWFVHPAERGYDRHVRLKSQGRGCFFAKLDLPVKAAWTMHTTVEGAGQQSQFISMVTP